MSKLQSEHYCKKALKPLLSHIKCVCGGDGGFIKEGGCFYTFSKKKKKNIGKSLEYIVGQCTCFFIKPGQKNNFADRLNGKRHDACVVAWLLLM